MPDGATGPAGLLRLMAWLSPAFPVGSFSYSHGLEQAVEDGRIQDGPALGAWIADLVSCGSGWNDAVLLSQSWRLAREGADLAELAALGEALAGSLERHRETMLQGEAFSLAAASWVALASGDAGAGLPYPVAVGRAAGQAGIALEETLAAYLQAFATTLLQAGIRLGVLGQAGASAELAGLEPLLIATARRAAGASIDDLGSCAVVSECMAMRHETQYSRLFRS